MMFPSGYGRSKKERAMVDDFANPDRGLETLDRTLRAALVGTIKGEMSRTL